MPEVRDDGTSILENKFQFKKDFFHMTVDSFVWYLRYPRPFGTIGRERPSPPSSLPPFFRNHVSKGQV